MQCSIDAVRGDEAIEEAARLIRYWRTFRDKPDSAEERAAELAVAAHLGEHFDGEFVQDVTGLIVMVNQVDFTSLWCGFPRQV